MFRLGLLYAKGRGVPEDEEEAAKFFRLAASNAWKPSGDDPGSLASSNLRLIGRYRSFDENEPDFSASDAISLALLWHRSREGNHAANIDHYRRAYAAVCEGLGIRQQDLGGMADWRTSPPGQRRGGAIAVLGQFVRLRTAMVDFSDERGSCIVGDIWGDRLGGEALAPALGRARRWYADQRREMAGGVEIFDAALCAMLGWDAGARVSVKSLLDDHGLPNDWDD
jgi:hypothetical protein